MWYHAFRMQINSTLHAAQTYFFPSWCSSWETKKNFRSLIYFEVIMSCSSLHRWTVSLSMYFTDYHHIWKMISLWRCCSALWCHVKTQVDTTFRRSMLSPSSGLMMETVCFSRTLLFTYESTEFRTQKKNTVDFTAVRTSNHMVSLSLVKESTL
jgi:hypothetical protein